MTDGKIPPAGQKVKKDRGAPNVLGKEGKKVDFGLVGIIGVSVAAGIFIWWMMFGKSEPQTTSAEDAPVDKALIREEKNPTIAFGNFLQTIGASFRGNDSETVEDSRPNEEREDKGASRPPPKPNITSTSTPPPSNLPPPTTSSTNRSNKDEITPEQRKLTSTVMANVAPQPAQQLPAISGGSDPFTGQSYAAGSANTDNRNNRTFLLQHGTNIPCALQTEIISTFSGLVVCSVINDVYSANGVTLLVEKGSRVFGNQNIALDQGQARVFVTWADIQTPKGVSIKIDSLGTGALGASGVDAWVDTHFKERFGGAILLSFLNDAFATLANSQIKNASVSTDNMQTAGEDMATKALENSINIKPTGYVQIGTRLNILIARDIDMSNVYGLSPF
ncbi:hypothetical protein TUM4438_31180 [Shewanella sairae]|uniref:TrbI/VirB10 family protein n=1 Tax=Shewanella sairae TaxID=190310 RepID=A0ABQ4PLB6_9GAMM|nr:type IV secretion system protein VirB10 [Shewanella sairae]MCL1131888.1 type IV secretion system protein VirB10 [Shewanella sairae]GIU48857.1 hypothetical protein TUM4438_31180 [Shewanella sairae]